MERPSNQAQTIKELFENNTSIRIPAYQRAYSWESKQCLQYLEDIKEQKGKSYYLGQILFEQEGTTIFIIDGQQRLTTTVLFFAALYKVLVIKGNDASDIKNLYLTDTFKTIDDDQVLFKKCTQKQLISRLDDTETISQRRIISAYKFFEEQLLELEFQELENIKTALEKAVISTYFIVGEKSKIEATQVFEYQNNRGKDLSRFEVIKAYLMHQIYINTSDYTEATNKINEIQRIVSKIYRDIEFVEGFFSENEILDNYCYLFFGIGGNQEAIRDRLKKEKDEDKSNWISSFFDGLVEFTSSAKGVVRNKHLNQITNLFFVGNEVNWKIVLLTLFYNGETHGENFDKILKLLEVLSFKLKLGDFRSDYLPSYAKKYFNGTDNYNIENLLNDIRNVTKNGFKWYWNNNEYFNNIIIDYIDNWKDHYDKKNPVKYILWQYENAQRISGKSGILLDRELYNDYTIEHIKPQTPSNETYSPEFVKESLHKVGNLALLTRSQNSKFGNKSFTDKRELFQDTALTTYTEIRENEYWTDKEIAIRHMNIAKFVKSHFDISKI